MQPLNNSDPNDLIKQCAATILDTIGKLNKSSGQDAVSKKIISKESSSEEKQLLEEFNQLPKHKRKMAISLFLAIEEMVKGYKRHVKCQHPIGFNNIYAASAWS